MAHPHKYIYDIDVCGGYSAAAHVIELVGSAKRVLDVGSGPGSITRFLKEPGGCSIVALENDAQSAELVAPYCERVLRCDLNASSLQATLEDAGKFDVVVLADVLEHLYDPWRVLRDLIPFLREGGYAVVSVPHAGHNAVLATLLNADFEYRDTGLLDRTHIRFFGMRNIQALIEQAGLTIIDARFVARYPGVTELSHHWAALPRRLQDALLENRFGAIYQVVVKATPAREGVVGLDLCALPVPERRGSWIERRLGPLGRRLTRNLDPAAKARLKRTLTRLGVLRSWNGK